jgi:hypothetical protein
MTPDTITCMGPSQIDRERDRCKRALDLMNVEVGFKLGTIDAADYARALAMIEEMRHGVAQVNRGCNSPGHA